MPLFAPHLHVHGRTALVVVQVGGQPRAARPVHVPPCHECEQYRPQVVVSYDPEGPYQHPDHVHAARAAAAAAQATGIPAKFYLTAMRPSAWQKIWAALRELGEDVPGPRNVTPEMRTQMAEAEARITTTIDIRPVLARKRDALFAHSSQIQESWFSKIPADIAEGAFGWESFVRASDSTGAPLPEDDIFAGLRTTSS